MHPSASATSFIVIPSCSSSFSYCSYFIWITYLFHTLPYLIIIISDVPILNPKVWVSLTFPNTNFRIFKILFNDGYVRLYNNIISTSSKFFTLYLDKVSSFQSLYNSISHIYVFAIFLSFFILLSPVFQICCWSNELGFFLFLDISFTSKKSWNLF